MFSFGIPDTNWIDTALLATYVRNAEGKAKHLGAMKTLGRPIG